MLKSFLCGLIAFWVGACFITEARAEVLFSTGFNTPTYTNGVLVGQDGWLNSSGTAFPFTVANSASDGFVSYSGNGEDVRRLFQASPVGSSVFLGANITLTSASAGGDYFLHLGDGGTTNFYSRIYARSTGAGFQLAMGTSTGATGLVYGGEIAFNTPVNILAKYDIIAGTANDVGVLFVNPLSALGATDTPYVAALNTGTDATSISSVHLRQSATTPLGSISSITIEAVPEPSSIALVSLMGCTGLVVAYRRRKARLSVA